MQKKAFTLPLLELWEIMALLKSSSINKISSSSTFSTRLSEALEVKQISLGSFF